MRKLAIGLISLPVLFVVYAHVHTLLVRPEELHGLLVYEINFLTYVFQLALTCAEIYAAYRFCGWATRQLRSGWDRILLVLSGLRAAAVRPGTAPQASEHSLRHRR